MDINLAALHTQVLAWAFALALLFGAVSQHTHFCTMGAVSDVVNMGSWTRMRQWGLAMAVAILGFAFLGWAEQIDPSKTFYASKRVLWLSALVGGGLFGFGMVLASGCGSKTLVRIGSGNLKSLVVFVVMGLSALATMKGITAVLRSVSTDRVFLEFSVAANLGSAVRTLGVPAPWAYVVAALLVAGALLVWVFKDRDFVRPGNLLAGLGIGALVVALWWVTGHLGHVLEHPLTLEETFVATHSGQMESFTFSGPLGLSLDWLMFYSDTSKLLTVGVVTVPGVVLGAWVVAMATRTFRWEGFGSTEDLANHLVGAVLMGIGGVTAMGCTVGQGLSGVSTLAAGSFVAVAAIVAGAVAGFKYQLWRLDAA